MEHWLKLFVHINEDSIKFFAFNFATLGFKPTFGTCFRHRLGFVVDYLSYAAIVGFMAGAALTIALQQLKGLLGIPTAFFTRNTDIVSVLRSVFDHTNKVWYVL